MATHDEMVMKLMKEVEDRKATLGARPRASLITNGILKIDDKNHININTIWNERDVVNAYAYVISTYDINTKAASDLGLISYEFTIAGYALDDWKHDLKQRLDIIKWSEKDAELKQMTKKLEGLVSEDLKTKNELEAISKSLGIA